MSNRRYDGVRIGLAVFFTAICFVWTARAEETVRRHVVIVANNNSLDEGVSPLRFADDDGARYFELFSAAGMDTHLLALLDEDAQTKFPEAAEAALLPRKAQLEATLASVFEEIEKENAKGETTHFTFVYAGHGNVGPNREGYINLLDERLFRSAFYREVIAPSPATINHIILDACHAYYLVNKRGAKESHRNGDFGDDIRDFLSTELLESYPNTGVILAASKDSETHEWHRLESGIFSHEILSALQGAADVDEDGNITYPEAAAFVEAANLGVKMPKARLNVYFKAPSNRRDAPLIALSSFDETPILFLGKAMGGRYTIEDARGIRTADLHFTNEQAVRMRLVGVPPFYLRTDTEEAEIVAARETDAASLSFGAIGENHRGGLDQSFRKHLFEVPFGLGFYRGMYAVSQWPGADSGPIRASAAVDAPAVETAISVSDTAPPSTPRVVYQIVGWSALGGGIAAGIASGVLYGTANASHDDYAEADDVDTVLDKRDETGRRLELSRLFMGLGVGLAVAGGVVLIVDTVLSPPKKNAVSSDKKEKRQTSSSLDIDLGTGLIGITGKF